jgi:isoleucyl-tRNA synthetase
VKYKEDKNIDLAQVGSDVLKFWKENKVFELSVSSREGRKAFTFYEGPPSANGTPGIHHVMARTVKDIFCRYKTLKGFQVKRKGGWDTHGLPVELQVEKELGITKEDIGKKISIEDYNKKCRETVMRYKSEWDDMTEKMGYWVDLDNPYITFENNYIESCWYLLKELYKKKLLYKGYSIQPYSPAAGTGLSSNELNMPGCYKDVKDTTVVAQFKIKLDAKSEFLFKKRIEKESEYPEENVLSPTLKSKDLYFLAWTTTPWTLPSNSALAIGVNISYLLVETINPYTNEPICVILAEDLFEKYFSGTKDNNWGKDDPSSRKAYTGGKISTFIKLDKFKGKDLVGIQYEQLLPYVQPENADKAFRVIPGDFVSTEDGTGIVHIAPTFGADDARVAKQAGVPAITVKDEAGNDVPLVDRQGKFVKQVKDPVFGLGGEYVKEEYLSEQEKEAELKNQQSYLKSVIAKLDKYLSADERLALKLKLENKAFKVEKYEHNYPHCWRTDKPVLYYPLDSWFIKTTAVKDRLAELNKGINWKPASTGTGRFGNWLENLVDWNLSRSRYWGTPLPIWRTEDGLEEKCIGSQKELADEIEKANSKLENTKYKIQKSKLADLHRPYVDQVVLVSDSGKPMFRESDLVDVWFDSGAMPYAQWHWPFENKDIFEKSFPADFISEGVDQTRGWFFTLHAIAGMLFDKVAFKNVVSTGLVLDKNGEKMSKRKGNVINPFEALKQYGPDATRWYMISNAPPWDNLKFNLDGITEVQRRFFGTLQNTYAFFALYSNLDNFTFSEKEIPLLKRSESDRWIISKLNTLIRNVDEAYNDYEPTRATREIQDFVSDDLSNWYVRLNRKRFWKGEYNEDKMAAYQTLYTCLETIAILASPVSPFYTEKLFQDLNTVSRKHQVLSVHLAEFPVSDEKLIDKDLEERMSLAQKISSLAHSLRKGHDIKVRQPLSRMLIPVLNDKTRKQIESVKDLILSEVNIKMIEYIDDTSGVLIKKIKPNFKKLGKEFGPRLKEVGAAISAMTKEDIRKIEAENAFKIKLTGDIVQITLEDVEISSEDIPGWSVASEAGLTVAIDNTITDELKKEGIARDIVNRVQNMRKDMGLEVQDKIRIKIQKKDELIDGALMTNKEYICSETQALSLELIEKLLDGREIEMDEHKLIMKIEV